MGHDEFARRPPHGPELLGVDEAGEELGGVALGQAEPVLAVLCPSGPVAPLGDDDRAVGHGHDRRARVDGVGRGVVEVDEHAGAGERLGERRALEGVDAAAAERVIGHEVGPPPLRPRVGRHPCEGLPRPRRQRPGEQEGGLPLTLRTAPRVPGRGVAELEEPRIGVPFRQRGHVLLPQGEHAAAEGGLGSRGLEARGAAGRQDQPDDARRALEDRVDGAAGAGEEFLGDHEVGLVAVVGPGHVVDHGGVRPQAPGLVDHGGLHRLDARVGALRRDNAQPDCRHVLTSRPRDGPPRPPGAAPRWPARRSSRAVPRSAS